MTQKLMKDRLDKQTDYAVSYRQRFTMKKMQQVILEKGDCIKVFRSITEAHQFVFGYK